MKRLFLIVSLFLTSFIFSQEKIEKYNSSYTGKDFNIKILEKKSGEVVYHIQTMSLDTNSKEAKLIVNEEREMQDFMSFLNSIKETYKNLCVSAKENKATEMDKQITYVGNVKFSSMFSFGSSWHFDFDTYLNPIFQISPTGDYLLIIKSGELESSSDGILKSKGFAIVFKSVNEIDDFISKLDYGKAKSFFAEKKLKEN